MTTIAATPLAEGLQSLVDARLDTIDRMLLGRVDRQDRLAIVREVEAQIFDQLGGRDAGTLDRDDVLAVLARLDPPEAYLPEGDSTASPRPARPLADFRGSARPAAPSVRLELISGVLGLVSLGIVFLGILFLFVELDEFALVGAPTVGFVPSLLAVIFAMKVRLAGPWAIVGLVTGLISLLGCLVGAGYFLTVLL